MRWQVLRKSKPEFPADKLRRILHSSVFQARLNLLCPKEYLRLLVKKLDAGRLESWNAGMLEGRKA
jgi:hypothetical protein